MLKLIPFRYWLSAFFEGIIVFFLARNLIPF